MTLEGRTLIGVGGVPAHDSPRAYSWERRLHWIMVVVALMSVPAFYLEEIATGERMRLAGAVIEWAIVGAFSGELLWMLHVTHQKAKYLLRNWLDVLIIVFALASIFGSATEWVALARLTRVALAALLLARVAGSLRNLLSPSGVPYLVGLGVISILLSGVGFYLLEPTVHTLGDGLWLALVTATTIGYGDFVPTSTAARVFAGLVVVIGFGLLSIMVASFAAAFLGADEKRLRYEMHKDIRDLREQFQVALGEEERLLRREMRRELRELREELAMLRRELEGQKVLSGDRVRDKAANR
ncbi:MAG TPA: ion channel [Burkholderiales bacterium]|nr:ion channel [Burkholderiales bacterium]